MDLMSSLYMNKATRRETGLRAPNPRERRQCDKRIGIEGRKVRIYLTGVDIAVETVGYILGYCRRQGELLLVYEFMPNGSLDKLLFDKDVFILDWRQRLQIIKGVASGLLYLHRGWDKVVIHRDIKASNVLLDSELNGRLGDFGLARLYDHGKDPHTTHVVRTMGYLAPELTRTGKATTGTDVFAFGAFLLEVACGRRPLDMRAPEQEEVLVDWVVANWQRGEILKSSDRRLAGEYQAEEMELVLKLGLLCCHPLPGARPGMQRGKNLMPAVPFSLKPPSSHLFLSLFLFL